MPRRKEIGCGRNRMSALDAMSLPVLDLAAGTVTLSLWAAGGVLLVFLAVALSRGALGRLMASVAVVGLVGVAVAAGFTLITRSDRAEERRALDRRLDELTERAIAPGSALACLDSGIGEAVEGACEKAVFASAETVAAATTLVSARLTLLGDALEFATRVDPNYEKVLADLRRAIEVDRFGFVAQVLAARDGCTPAKCDALQWFHEPNRIRANLNDRTFDGMVARNASNWANRSRAGTPVAAAPAPAAPPTGMTFPSAASIPPVSIMNNEPGSAAASAPSAAAPAPPATARRVQPAAASRTAQPHGSASQAPARTSPNPNGAQRAQQPQQP
jgi:hypothetical protein